MGFFGCRRPRADDPHVIFAAVDMCEKHDPLFAGSSDSGVPLLLLRMIRVVKRQCERIREDTGCFLERNLVPLQVLLGLLGLTVVMAQQLLDRSDVRAGFQQMRRERMA